MGMDLGLSPSSSSRQEPFIKWDKPSSGSIWDKVEMACRNRGRILGED